MKRNLCSILKSVKQLLFFLKKYSFFPLHQRFPETKTFYLFGGTFQMSTLIVAGFHNLILIYVILKNHFCILIIENEVLKYIFKFRI